MKRIHRFVRRCIRTATSLAKDQRLPRWARAALMLAPLCVIIIGPFDEIAVGAALAIVYLRHRAIVHQAWAATA